MSKMTENLLKKKLSEKEKEGGGRRKEHDIFSP
jgi:hypothetical protein